MSTIANDPKRTIAIFLNDFDQEFADGLEKLSKTLGRKLQGIIFVDSHVAAESRDVPDKQKVFGRIIVDFSDEVALREAIKPYQDKVLLATCSSERNQPYLQKLLPHLPYILGPTETSLDWSTNKAYMRAMLRSFNPQLVPEVVHVTENSDEQIRQVLDCLEFPVIVKPVGLAASLLVNKAHDEQELRALLEKGFMLANEVYKRDAGRGGKPSFLVEEFISGDMYSVDVYVNSQGKVWPLPLLRSWTAHTLGKEGFYTYQADSFTDLTPKQTEAGHNAATQAVHALGLRSCVAHVELFLTANGWKIVELGPRAGGLRQDVYWVSYGIDHAYNELLIKVGLPPKIKSKPIAYSTTVNVYPDQEGIITDFEGLTEARQNPSVYKLMLHARLGDTALLSHNGGKIIIRGVMANKDLGQLTKDAEEVRNRLKVQTRRQYGE